MYTLFSYFVGFASGIAGYYWLSHKVNPTTTQANIDAAKAVVTSAVVNPITAEVTKVETEIKAL